jgi:hypothetical protein
MITSLLTVIAMAILVLPFVLMVIFRDQDGRFLFLAIIAVMLFVPFMRFPFVKSGGFYLYPPILLLQLLFARLILFRERPLPRFGIVDLCFLFIFLTSFVSMLQSVINMNWGIKFLYVFLFGGFLFSYCMRFIAGSTEGFHQLVLRKMNLMLVIIALWCVVEYIFQRNLYYELLAAVAGPLDVIFHTDVYRARGPTEHPLFIAMLFIAFLPYNLMKIVEKSQVWHHLSYTFILFIGLVTTGSRGSLIAFAIGFILLLVLLIYNRLFTFMIGFTTSIMIMISIPVIASSLDHFARITQLIQYGFSQADPTRYYGLLWAFDIFKQKWVWGVGPLNALNYKMTFKNSSYDATAGWSDWGIENSWMTILIEHGVVGTVPFIVLNVYLLVRLLSCAKKSSDMAYKCTSIGLFTGFFCFLLNLSTFNALDGSFTAIGTYGIMIGLVELQIHHYAQHRGTSYESNTLPLGN